MDERPKLPHYDPDYCLKVAKWAASVCVGILSVELLVLLLVFPENGKCPGWMIYADNGPVTSAWAIAGIFTGLPTIWICYVAARWKQKFSRLFYESIAFSDNRRAFPDFSFFRKSKINAEQREPDSQDLNFQQIFLLDANTLFLRVCIGWCLFCATPLLLMITNCTNGMP